MSRRHDAHKSARTPAVKRATVFLPLVLAECATAPPARHTGELPELADAAPSLPEMRTAWEQCRLIRVVGEQGIGIPVRAFGEEGRRLPVLMLHGLQSHSGWFVQSAAFIASLGHPVYAIDRRGSGLSAETRGDCRDFREMINDVRTVARHAMEKHHVERVHVMGHCFGAIPAAAFACAEPDMLASVILPTPGIFTKTDLTMGQKFRVAVDQLGRPTRYLSVPLETTDFTELDRYQDFIASDPMALRAATTSFYWNVARARKYVTKHIGGITCPVWMGISGQDPIVDNDTVRKWFDRLPAQDKELVVFPGARHILEFSPEKEAFFEEIRAWFQERD